MPTVCVPILCDTIYRLLEWIFYNVHSEENTDHTKAVFLRGLYELLTSEGGKSPHGPMLPVSLGREGGREGGWEGEREGRDGGREGRGREGGRDGGREGREGGYPCFLIMCIAIIPFHLTAFISVCEFFAFFP